MTPGRGEDTRILLPRKTERLLLRPYLSEDAEDFYAYISDSETVRFEPYDPLDRETAMQELENRIGDPDFIAVCLPPSEDRPAGRLIGHLYFTQCAFYTWEIGWMLHPDHLHRGYATEAAAAVIGAVFEECDAHRVIAMCNPENTASVRVMQRLGMRHEGTLSKNLFFRREKDGTPIWLDTAMYAVLSSEWQKQID